MLTVYKASAGSGKTFQLVVEYLKLILENPFNYKHILAVTFTNKATNEMKSRILEQLFLLANNKKSDYLLPLQNENKYSEEFIRKQAGKVLKNILHDYNRFSVSTIDSFTQKVIKSFNRELGISPNFTVELDNDMVLSEAVDRMFARISKDRKLLNWLKEFSREKIENNQSQRLDDDIKKLGKELFKESFQVFFPEKGDSGYNRENLSEFNKELHKIKVGFENTLKKKGGDLFNLIVQNGYSVDDFHYKKSGVAGFIQNIANGLIKEPGARAVSASEEVEKWYSAKHDNAAEIHQLVETSLQHGLIGLIGFYNHNKERYFTALAVLKQLRMLGILSDLKDEIKALLHEKGLLQLSDSNLLLSKIIGQSESPFVYEKIGNYYKHFMLDEFQDTSGLQWDNFKPLVINSLAEGHSNLVVGDVKQSIYRWRNSDWNILAEQLDTDFNESQLDIHTLKFNWRSDKNIIDFNNNVFDNLKESFKDYLFNGIDDSVPYTEKFDKIYTSYKQKQGKKDGDKVGFMQANFLPKDDFYEESTSLLVNQVKQLQDNGIKASETAILIRRNRDGAAIIEEFLAAAKLEENRKYNLTVLSNESLFLHASKGVLFVMEIIELLIEPDNPVTKATILQLWQTWLKPELAIKGISTVTNNGQNLIDFTDYENWNLESDFEEIFKNELAVKIEEAKEKILLSSLDESITQICSLFGLFNFDSELPFLQTLIDEAGELKSSLSNDLSNLLFWWNEKGYKTSVNVNENVESIRLLTVHKSKGLEFKAVLIPFLNWETNEGGSHSSILWCEPQSSPFNQFPLLPVQAGSNLAESEFRHLYFEEKVNGYIDTLNLVYVAFTRAKKALIINCPEAVEPSRSSKPSDKSVNYILFKALQNQAQTEPFKNCWNQENTVFQYGSIKAKAETSATGSPNMITHYHFNDFSNKIKLRYSGEDFLISEEEHHSVKNTGKIIHEILSDIETGQDIEKACIKAFHDGKVNEKELLEIQQSIKENLDLPEVKPWFDGSYKIMNERNLLTTGKLLRPDRIMTNGNKAIVVDYKTGEKNQDKYNRQVRGYAQTLKDTGFEKVTGYLWYLGLNEVEKVCEF
ncbi:MAG: UvrD-helicase domain-containing protein [Bacteroidota bacterium]